MKWAHFVVALILVSGCTNLLNKTQGQPGAQQPALPGIGQSGSQIPGVGGGDAHAQLSEIGINAKGQAEGIRVRVFYPKINGAYCDLNLEYNTKLCVPSEPSAQGNKYVWCKSGYEYQLSGDCASQFASQIKGDAGYKITSQVTIPLSDKATDFAVEFKFKDGDTSIMLIYTTAKFAAEYYPSSFTIEDYENRIYASGGAYYLFIDNPLLFFKVWGPGAGTDVRQLQSANTGRIYTGKPIDIFNLIPEDFYGGTTATMVCYHPFGVVRIDPAVFRQETLTMFPKSDFMYRFIAPVDAFIMPMGEQFGSGELDLFGANLNQLKKYGSHYQACQNGCFEACVRRSGLVLRKGDCTAAYESSQPAIVSKLSTIYDEYAKIGEFPTLKDAICFGILNSVAESQIFGSHSAGNGATFYSGVFVDKSIKTFIISSTDDPAVVLKDIVNKMLDTDYTLKPEKQEKSCYLFSYGKASEFTGYAGYCLLSDGLKLLFTNSCTQGENCLPSANNFFERVTK